MSEQGEAKARSARLRAIAHVADTPPCPWHRNLMEATA